MTEPIRTLLFSTLYPSSLRPLHGIFVETRLRELLKTGQVETRVVAPVPWFYSKHLRHGDQAAMARTPAYETWHGIDVSHPRYPLIPKLGMTTAPLTLALGARSAVQAVRDEGFDFDLIDAHYCYPDGVAAAILARWFKRPFVITARGSDINLIGNYVLPRRMMRWSFSKAAATVGVSKALADRLQSLGAPLERVSVLRNGVDAQRFYPVPQTDARARLGLDGAPLLLSVGNLVDVKRHDFVIKALSRLRQQRPDARLAIVGSGHLRAALEDQAKAAGLTDAVVFAGAVDQANLRWWYSAADVLVLASSREGWPNVLLEAMACGTPVVASRVGGVSEVVNRTDIGTTVDIRDDESLAAAIVDTLSRQLDRNTIRRYAQEMSWTRTSEAQVELFSLIRSDNHADPASLTGFSP